MNLHAIHKLLIYGGSFDPPHVAHVQLPRLARDRLGCDAVAYIPAGRAPHKVDQVQTPATHRLAMTRLAVADDPRSLVLAVEAERDPAVPSYTVDTLEWLAKQLPDGAAMRLLIGTDQMAIFDQWKSAGRIMELAEPVVMLRPLPPAPPPEVAEVSEVPTAPVSEEAALSCVPAGERDAWRGRLLALPPVAVSSTDIRRRVAAGEPIAGLVPPAVADYIVKHRLYASG